MPRYTIKRLTRERVVVLERQREFPSDAAAKATLSSVSGDLAVDRIAEIWRGNTLIARISDLSRFEIK